MKYCMYWAVMTAGSKKVCEELLQSVTTEWVCEGKFFIQFI